MSLTLGGEGYSVERVRITFVLECYDYHTHVLLNKDGGVNEQDDSSASS